MERVEMDYSKVILFELWVIKMTLLLELLSRERIFLAEQTERAKEYTVCHWINGVMIQKVNISMRGLWKIYQVRTLLFISFPSLTET